MKFRDARADMLAKGGTIDAIVVDGVRHDLTSMTPEERYQWVTWLDQFEDSDCTVESVKPPRRPTPRWMGYALVAYALGETWFFGWNLVPQSPPELVADILGYLFGVYVFLR